MLFFDITLRYDVSLEVPRRVASSTSKKVYLAPDRNPFIVTWLGWHMLARAFAKDSISPYSTQLGYIIYPPLAPLTSKPESMPCQTDGSSPDIINLKYTGFAGCV